jgi:hypothetical protein
MAVMDSESKTSDVSYVPPTVLEKRKRDCSEGDMEAEPPFPTSKLVKVQHEPRVSTCTGIIPCELIPLLLAAFL